MPDLYPFLVSLLKVAGERADQIGGLVIVSLFYWFRFNNLRCTKSYTAANLYYVGLLAFIVPFAALYFACSIFLTAMPATLLVMAVWVIPFPGRAWRNLCHAVAKIPTSAYRLRTEIAAAPFQITKDDEPAVQRKLARCGYDIEDFTSAQATIIQGRLVKAAAIKLHLETWATKYRTFVARNCEEYEALIQSFDLLSFKVVRHIKQSARIATALGFAEAESSAVEDWEALESSVRINKSEPHYGLRVVIQSTSAIILEDLRKELDFFLDRLLFFVSRGILDGELDFRRRRQALQRMGFAIDERIPSVMPAVIFVLLVVSICSWLWLQAFGTSVTGNKAIGSAKILTVGALNILLNVLLVQYAKRNFAFANVNNTNKPWLFIFTVGLIPTIVVEFARIVFEYFQFRGEINNIVGFMERISHTLPWSLNIWATGIVVAFLSIDSTWETIWSPWLRRVLDGVVFGACWVAALLGEFFINQYFRVEGFPPVHLLPIISTTFCFGFLIGFLILSAMRNAPLGSTEINRVLSMG